MASRSASQSRVEPSTSVNNSVTVPDGRPLILSKSAPFTGSVHILHAVCTCRGSDTGASRLGVKAMSTLIRTEQVPAADRMDFVRDMAADTWVPMEFRYECGDCWGEFRASGMGPMQIVVMDIMPITVRRTR